MKITGLDNLLFPYGLNDILSDVINWAITDIPDVEYYISETETTPYRMVCELTPLVPPRENTMTVTIEAEHVVYYETSNNAPIQQMLFATFANMENPPEVYYSIHMTVVDAQRTNVWDIYTNHGREWAERSRTFIHKRTDRVI